MTSTRPAGNNATVPFKPCHEDPVDIVLLLNLVLITALVVVGLSAHSIGVLAEGADYLADAAAICVSLLAIWLSRRSPTTTRPLGYPNATKVAALVNGGWLIILSILVALTAARRLVSHTSHVSGLPVLVVSGIAAALMFIGALILGGDDVNGDLNMRAVLLDTAGAGTWQGWDCLDRSRPLVSARVPAGLRLPRIRDIVAPAHSDA